MKPVEIEFLVKDNTRQGLSGVSGGIDGVERDATAAQKRIAALEAQIVRLQKVMAQSPKMDQTENIRQIDALQRELVELQATSQKIDLTPRNAPAAMRTYNGLNVSIQQIARELPSLAMGPQMFFLAISNNLPIFTDELARARKEYDALVASGQKGVPVWKQVLSSIGSWQTLMAVGIMLSVSYGKEIGQLLFEAVSRKSCLRRCETVGRSLPCHDGGGKQKCPAGGREAEPVVSGCDGSFAGDERTVGCGSKTQGRVSRLFQEFVRRADSGRESRRCLQNAHREYLCIRQGAGRIQEHG